MRVIPFVHEGLGNSSYLVGLADGRAVAIDPDRSVARYLRAAEQLGWRIDAVFETHLHADFVSGSHELAARLGAKLFIPKGADSKLQHHPMREGEGVTLDGIQLGAVASPGHTPEHLSYVLRAGSQPSALFSGGSLSVGGAARTDLFAPGATEELTRAQFRTLKHAFSSLPDETLLYPTHGGGSFCSADSGGERTSTLGAERAGNPAMSAETEDEFVRWFPATFASAPAYFFRMRAYNQAGPRLRSEIGTPSPLLPQDFEEAARTALVIDTRSVEEYSASHVPGSLHIPFRDVFAIWLGWLVPADTRLLFLADEKSLEAIIDECLLVGYQDFAGWLDGGVEAWRASGRSLSSVGFVDGDAARSLIAGGAEVIDVREPDEFAQGHVSGALHLPLGRLPQEQPHGTRDGPIVVYCGHAERASTAASILERAGHNRVVNVRGGYAALEAVEEERHS